MIFKPIRKGAFCTLAFVAFAWSQGSAAQHIPDFACQDSGFEAFKAGEVREFYVPLSKEPALLFRVVPDALRRDLLRGHELSSAARMMALGSFAKRLEKQRPTSAGEYQLVAEGLQFTTVNCRRGQVMVFWILRSKIKWDLVAEGGSGSTFSEARRILDGPPSLVDREVPNARQPRVFIDSQ